MESHFWHTRWQENQIGFHQAEINTHLQAFWPGLDLPGSCGVFAPLCGKSRDLLWLRAQGHRVLGVEISPLAVQSFFDENRLTPIVSRKGRLEHWETDGLTLICGDFFNLTAADLTAYQAVYDRASLIALPPAMRGEYAAHLARITGSRTECLLVTMEYDQAEMSGPPFAVHEAEVRSLYDANFQVRRLYTADVLDENAGFRTRGLTALTEKVYRLSR